METDQGEADRSHRAHPDRIAAVVGIFVGALALIVSTYNVYLQRKQVGAQVWPRLLFMPSFNDEEGFYYALENGGIGPAEISHARVLVDDKPVEDWHQAILRMTGKDLKDGEWGWSTMRGTLLTPGQTRHVLTLGDKSVGSIMFKQQHRLRIEVCYCSALEDCWLLQDNRPRPIARCTPPADAFGE